jgi:DNA-binding transcriptional LysR family regulator
MDWDKLKIFHAVVEAGNFTKSTYTLNLSQSAISRQIQSLEQELKTQLFERHARGLSLTENGEYLFKTAHEVISKLKDVESTLMDKKDKPSGKLTVTTVGTVILPLGLFFLSIKVDSTSFNLEITS